MKTKSSLLPAGFNIEKLQRRLNTLLDALERSKQAGEIPSEAMILEAADLSRFHSDWALAHCLAKPRFDRLRASLAKEALRLMPLFNDVPRTENRL